MTSPRSESAEAALQAAGFSEVRIADHGDVARVTVPSAELDRFADAGVRDAVLAAVRAVGFRFVALDLEAR